MCAAILPAEPDSALATQLRATVSAVVTPVTAAASARYSADLLRLVSTSGVMTASARIPALRARAPVSWQYRQAEAAVRATCAGLSGSGWFRPQSALVVTGTRLRVLVRLETPAGPVLAGGAGPAAVARLVRTVAELNQLAPAMASAPPGWDRRPLLLRPAVAAVLLAGVRLVLGGAAAGRLAGRRVLPGLTLTDRPAEHAEGSLDDRGVPALSHPIVQSGRVVPLPPGSGPGIPSGRAVWCHDTGQPVIAPVFGLALAGLPAMPRPEDAVELVACAEGLRRYHKDGTLRLTCLARLADSAGCFLLDLRARPLSMLRGVTAAAGQATDTYLEHEINTPSLVLLSAGELARKCDVHLSTL